MALRDDLLRALRFTAADRARISVALQEQKIVVYEETLRRLAEQHGVDPDLVELSTVMRRELVAEAQNSADLIVDAYNRDLRDQIDMIGNAFTPTVALQRLEEWSRQRAKRSAPVVAITETYRPHADATVAFYRNAGLAPEFDFGGHGDAGPVCAICKALVAGSPWPMDAVIAIGSPHPQCKQAWHVHGKVAFPHGYKPGQGGPAGIIGTGTLVQREGSIADAVAAVEAMKP